MAAFPPTAHALKHAVAGLGPELALILSLEMAATDVQACRSKHATRKPVTVETFVSKLSLFLCVMLTLTCLKMFLCNCTQLAWCSGADEILVAILVG